MHEITITDSDLRDPLVDQVLEQERSLARPTVPVPPDVPTPFYLRPAFYYGLASCLAVLAVWAATEPFYSDSEDSIPFVSDYLLFGPAAAAVGCAIGLVYGIVNRNASRALHCGAVGLGMGLLVTLGTTIVADVIFGRYVQVAVEVMGRSNLRAGPMPFHGMGFYLLLCGRGLAWSLVGGGSGLALGTALKSASLRLTGVVGGLVGGMLGGLLFDPITVLFAGPRGEAAVSRGVGLLAIGLLVGIFVGIFESISKEAWLLMLHGPLAGKQFILFRPAMSIGSAPKCDIYLFKDSAVAPRHASILKRGTRYVLRDEGSANGTLVNGARLDPERLLVDEDVVSIGSTVLKYHERDTA